ncbi:MAG: hypothetical protein A2X08_18215 [Bacteroidetes bacterium GWA2_32_17]|nr:MAG: hypothetical protein A2X08_18215 [Bacteroidetes bacterium GWA2_32_17]
MWLAVLLITTIGVPASTITTTHGNRTSTMAIRTTTIRTTQTMCVQFGVLNKTFFQKTCQRLQRPDSVFLIPPL